MKPHKLVSMVSVAVPSPHCSVARTVSILRLPVTTAANVEINAKTAIFARLASANSIAVGKMRRSVATNASISRLTSTTVVHAAQPVRKSRFV